MPAERARGCASLPTKSDDTRLGCSALFPFISLAVPASFCQLQSKSVGVDAAMTIEASYRVVALRQPPGSEHEGVDFDVDSRVLPWPLRRLPPVTSRYALIAATITVSHASCFEAFIDVEAPRPRGSA